MFKVNVMKLLIPFLIFASYGVMAQTTETKSDSTNADHVKFRTALPSNVLNNKPLFLVEGVEKTENYISTISPSNIASITVLKDSASIAPYGAKGKYGVVSIKLK